MTRPTVPTRMATRNMGTTTTIMSTTIRTRGRGVTRATVPTRTVTRNMGTTTKLMVMDTGRTAIPTAWSTRRSFARALASRR